MSDREEFIYIIKKLGIKYSESIERVDEYKRKNKLFKNKEEIKVIHISEGIGYMDLYGEYCFTMEDKFITWGLWECYLNE